MANELRQEIGRGTLAVGERILGDLPRNTEETVVKQPHRGAQERKGRFARC